MRIDVEALFDTYSSEAGTPPVAVDAVERAGLSIFAADAMEAAARYHIDPAAAIDWVSVSLRNQVRLAARVGRRPEIAITPLPAPVFIVSAARTGSTLLHRLLALEPSFRAPALWELRHPDAACDEDLREAAIAETRAFLGRVPPAALRRHPMTAEAPEECHWILLHNAERAGLQATWRYWEWLRRLDQPRLLRLFSTYRRQVQVLQARSPRRRWLSKAYAHQHYWPVFFDVFPDAVVVRIHRDPRASIASICSLVSQLSGRGDPVALGDLLLQIAVDGHQRMMEADRRAPEGQVVDILYEDLVGSPARTTLWLASRLAVPSPEALHDRVARYLASRTAIRAAPHRYALEDFGLTATGVSDAFEPYINWVRSRVGSDFAN